MIVIIIIIIIIIFIINYKSKQKEEKMKMSDLQTANTMIFISIIDDNVTFTKVVVLAVSKKGVRKDIKLSYKFVNQKTNKKRKSDIKNHEFTNEIMI